MEDMIQELNRRCTDLNLWYELYADDLVVCVNHKHLEQLLARLQETSTEYDLRINPKKCAIFAIKNHKKIDEKKTKLHGIPVATEYCYLGITLNHSGSLEPHLDRIKQRSNYLRANMRYYTHDLSFQNQYLLW